MQFNNGLKKRVVACTSNRVLFIGVEQKESELNSSFVC